MSRAVFTPEVDAYIREHAYGIRSAKLTKMLNDALGTSYTAEQVSNYKHRQKIKSGVKGGNDSSYPEDLEDVMRELAPGKTSHEIARAVNEHYGSEIITPHQVAIFKKNRKITSGLDMRFKEGQVSPTKGKKQEDFMTPEAIERTKATRFKKGNKPVNELPVGSIVKSTEGYLLRKRSMTGSQWERWEFLHRAVWEEHYGPVPDGCMITFADGNSLNCDIENLILETKAQRAIKNNKYNRFPKSYDGESAEALNKLADLKMAITKAKKRRKK